MSWPAAVASIQSLGTDWRPPLCAFVLALALSIVGPRRWRPASGSLLAPLALLALRPWVFLLPIPGALASSDQVIFWSAGALCYHLLVGACAWVLVLPMFPAFKSDFPAPAVLTTYLLCGSLVSACLMPFEGAPHFYLPFHCILSLLRLLLFHPLTVPVVVAAVAVQLYLAVRGGGRGARELDKLLALVLLAGGLLHLILAWRPGEVTTFMASGTASLHEWPRPSPEAPPIVLDSSDFLRAWGRQLPEIARCRVSAVELHWHREGSCAWRPLLDQSPTLLVLNWTDILGPLMGGFAVTGLVMVVGPRIRFRRGWRRNTRQGHDPSAGPVQTPGESRG